MPTTYREGREIRSDDGAITNEPQGPVEVVQLPNRDAAAALAHPPAAPAPAKAVKPAKPTPAVKSAVKQARTRTAKAAKASKKT